MTDEDVAKDSEVQNLMNELSRDGKRKPNGGNGPVRGGVHLDGGVIHQNVSLNMPFATKNG